jgi:hypothetical protein
VGGGRGGFPAAFFSGSGFRGSCGGGLFGVEICGLQRRRSRLIGGLGGLFLAALKTIAHPFTHVRLVTQMRRREQWFTVVSRIRNHPSTWLRAGSGHWGPQGRAGGYGLKLGRVFSHEVPSQLQLWNVQPDS